MSDEAHAAIGEVEAEAAGPGKKGFQFPGTLTVLIIVTFLVWLVAFFIPSGTYQHDESGVPVPGSYERIDSPQDLGDRTRDLFLAPVNGLYGLQDPETGRRRTLVAPGVAREGNHAAARLKRFPLGLQAVGEQAGNAEQHGTELRLPASHRCERVRLKLIARTLGIRRLDLGPQGGYVLFEERNSIDPASVIRMLQRAPREYRLEGPLKLRVSRPLEKEEARFEFAQDLLKRLETPTVAAASTKSPARA